MKNKEIIVAVLLAVVVTITIGQQSLSQKTIREVMVPREIVLPLIAYQPKCPLKLEDMQVRKNVEGGTPSPILRFRNISGKTIRSYKISYLMPGGMGGSWGSSGERILPGELIPEKDIPTFHTVIPLTDDLIKSLKLDGPMQAIWVFIVDRIEFEDGFVYEDEKTGKALKTYFETLRQQ
jgi:hypothetical protein